MPNLSENLGVAIYARVSTEEQREGQTIDSQVAELEHFARGKSWSVTGIYKDEGWSGSLLARPQLDRLRDDASAGKFTHVIINDVDRLARDVSHLGIVKRDLERLGVEIVFRKLPAEKSPTYNLMVNILGSFAEFEREMITDRTRRGRRHKVEGRQQFLGSKAAYGYQYVPRDRAAGKDGYLEVVPEEAAIVRLMYGWVDREHLSARKVTERLNDASVRPRSGRLWAKSTVLRVLRNETYAGVWYYNKHYSCEPARSLSQAKYRRPKSSNRLRLKSEWLPVILPTHLRVIEREQWQRVQGQLANNIAFSPRNSKHEYLLRGLVRCGGCAAMFVGDPCHGRFFYRCSRRCKKTPIVSEDVLNETVWSAVAEAILNPAVILHQVRHRKEREEQRAVASVSELSEIKRALQQLEEEESRTLTAYRTGVISPAQLGRELEKLQTRNRSLEIRKQNLAENKTAPSSDVARSVTDYCKQVRRRLNLFTLEERQRFLRLLIKSIIFDGKQVRIRSIIPIDSDNAVDEPRKGSEGELATVLLDTKGRIAATSSQYWGRNSDRIADIRSSYWVRNSASRNGFEFNLVKAIVKKAHPAQTRNKMGQFVGAGHELKELHKAA